MIRLSFNTDLLKERARAVRRGLPDAQRLAVAALASGIATECVTLTRQFRKVDTGRYIRGWEIANNQLPGVVPRPLTPLTASRRASQNRSQNAGRLKFYQTLRDQTQVQIERMSTWAQLDKNDYYKAKIKTLKKLDKIIDRAVAYDAMLKSAEGGTAIVIGRRAGTKTVSLGALGQVIAKIYGGTGRVYQLGGKWYATITNLEPHSLLVEWGFVKRVRSETGEALAVKAYGTVILGKAIAVYRSLGGVSRGDVERKFLAEIRKSARSVKHG